jgi:hypothetical protein
MDGILSQLGFSLMDRTEVKDRRKVKLQYSLKLSTSLEKSEDVLGFKVYSGEERQKVIKFCGWTDFSRVPIVSGSQAAGGGSRSYL